MNNIFEKIKNNALFRGIPLSEFESMLRCLSAKTINYQKNEIIILAGNQVSSVGIVLDGQLQVIKEDINGKINILTELSKGDLFGEVFACADIDRSPVSVKSCDDSTVLLINYKKIVTTCSSSCSSHTKLIENMLSILANKNLMLNKKIEILSKRTTREKLLSFFDLNQTSPRLVVLPFNREELAQYLCVDRSAMSAELSRMQKDGLIKVDKNVIKLL